MEGLKLWQPQTSGAAASDTVLAEPAVPAQAR